jgi:DNA-binding CsgD family transcriptional regulator
VDVLVGREAERQVIEALVAGARVGQSGTLVLVGEAGIGKTSLLESTAVTAVDHGMRLLRATGSVAEAEVPFGGLLELLRPALSYLDAIPGPQAQALAAALALRPGESDDRFAIGAATLSLLSRLAEEQPLTVLVDDAHLLDRPSAQALCFACRRLTADPIAVLLAVREGSPSAVTDADLPQLHVSGLAAAAADHLVSASGHRLGPDVLARLRAATGGNPLALIELAGDADGLVALPPDAPVPVPASLARAFGRRADLLSPAAQTAVLVAAAAGPDLGLVARACTALGVSAADLDEAQAADLLRVDVDRVVFRHGLVRSGVYAQASPAARRAVHRALADALGEHDHDLDRRAWHLAEAALGPDEETADAVDAAAVRARERSAHAVAALGFERAARLSPLEPARVQRLVSGAECAWQAGLVDTALDLLEQAAASDQPLALRVRAASLSGAIAARTGSLEVARDILLATGRLAAQDDPTAAITLLAQAVLTCLFAADTATAAEAATRIEQLAGRVEDRRARWMGEMAVGVAGVLSGRGGSDRIREAVATVATDEELLHDVRLAPWLVLGPLFLRESATGRDLVTTVTEHLRRRGAVGELPFISFQLGRDQATTDLWDDAEATYTEGIHLAREVGHSTDLAACLAGLAAVEARRGKDEACRRHAEEALQLSREHGIGFFHAWSYAALGELSLGLGRAAEARAHLEQLDDLLRALRFADVDLSPAPDLVEALVRLGELDRARDLAVQHLERARAKGQPWAVARALRAVGATCPDDAVDDAFTSALALHERTPDSFETARTQLAQGARLRRARRRVDARVALRAALAAFERLGALPWAEQAVAELGATGETAQRRGAGGLSDLTPQELQVARMLAAGRTTRESAAALFLSPKTIEYHLRHVYLKLDVRSRAELSARLAGPPR